MTLMTVAASAQLNYKVQTACHPDDVKHYDTERLRSAFLMEKVMSPDEINLTYTLYDRLIYGGVMPVNKTLVLETFDDLKAEHFLDRRELGVINVGGPGVVTVDGKESGSGCPVQQRTDLIGMAGEHPLPLCRMRQEGGDLQEPRSGQSCKVLHQLSTGIQGVCHPAHHYRQER